MALKAQIDITADASGVKTGIAEAKKSINSLGVAVVGENTKSSKSIDNYVKKLQQQQKTMGMSSREAEVYKLGLRGASDAQLKAADSSLKLSESYKKTSAGIKAFAVIAVTATIAAAAAFDQIIKKAGAFQGMAEKTGETAENIASLSVAASIKGLDINTVADGMNKLTRAMTGVDDESAAAGAAIKALGLNLQEFKSLAPADQLVAVGKAMNGFEEGAGKSAVAMALFGRTGAEMLGFLRVIGEEGGRQAILSETQIRQSDEYSDKQAELRAQIGLHAQAIATQLLPAYNDLSSAFRDIIKDVANLDSTAKDLGKSSAITDFADGAVVAIAVVAESIAFLVKSISAIGGSFKTVLADIETTGSFIANAIPAALGNEAANKSLKQSLANRNKILADANKAYDDLKNYDGAATSNSLRSRSADRKNIPLQEDIASLKRAAGSLGSIGGTTKPRLEFRGAADKSGASKAASEAKALAKAQLDSDLDQIKKASEATTNVYDNAEKVMEALRSASLIDEKEYYASKLAFLNLNSAAQEAELQAEIARMQQEKLTGKDKLDNQKKIADAEAKLAKIRGDATTSVQILGIQQEASIKKVAQAYKDATEAAQDYLATVQKQSDREIAGIGRGAKFNAESADRNKIEDKFTGRKQELGRDLRNNDITAADYAKYLKLAQDTYDKEVTIYESSRGKIAEAQEDWTNGATKALEDYRDASLDIAGQTADAFKSAFQGIEDALVKFVTTGKLDFRSFADSLIADFARIQIRQAMGSVMGGGQGGGSGFMGMLGGLAGMFGGTSGTASLASSMGGDSLDNMLKLTNNFAGRASGGPVSARNLYQVNEKGPELLNMGGKQYLMMAGESGKVTSNADSASQPSVTVNVTSSSGDPAEIRRSAAAGAKSALNLMSGARRYG